MQFIGRHGTVVKACDCKRDGCRFDSHSGNELLFQDQDSVNQDAMPRKFGGKWGREC